MINVTNVILHWHVLMSVTKKNPKKMLAKQTDNLVYLFLFYLRVNVWKVVNLWETSAHLQKSLKDFGQTLEIFGGLPVHLFVIVIFSFHLKQFA